MEYHINDRKLKTSEPEVKNMLDEKRVKFCTVNPILLFNIYNRRGALDRESSLRSKFLEKNHYQKRQIWSFETHFSNTRWHQIQNFDFSYF